MSFLRRVAGLSLRDRVRSSVIREELGVDPLLLRVERSQMRWLGHLVRMPPGRLPGEVFRARPTGRRARGRPRTRWRDYELNKRLRAPVKAFYSHLREVALPCFSGRGGKEEGEAQVSLTHRGDGGGVSIKLKSELAGLPFHWEFHCTAPPVDTVCSQLVRPLLVMSQLLQTQVDQLGALLARKDAEIQDYKENGATLSRVRLQTEVFDEQTYKDNIVAQVLPQVSSGQREVLGFDTDLRELYSTVVAYGSHGKRKRAQSEDHASEDAPLAAEEQEADHAPSHAPTPG
ncbi:Non-ous end-joining factor 1 [Merluccius polli]|uniref:Non-ous end-joining factor 1 n=1 Tax=Merluccius polli TaxID=89951 RepID=A0AA47NRM2_MERPO|nr:Non-ous end-joining factor 1 [Merluccius polli]